MRRLWESIFGLKRGFLNQDGELSLGFNPKWPTEPLINLGALNWALGALALMGIAYLVLRLRRGVLSRERRWAIDGGIVALVLLVLALISGTVAFNVALAA